MEIIPELDKPVINQAKHLIPMNVSAGRKSAHYAQNQGDFEPQPVQGEGCNQEVQIDGCGDEPAGGKYGGLMSLGAQFDEPCAGLGWLDSDHVVL